MNTSRLSSRLLMVAALSLAVSACGAPEEETPASADINSPAIPTPFEMDENGQVVQPVDAVGGCQTCYSTGWYDSQVNGVASGWVCAPFNPNNVYNVSIYKYEYYGWRLVGAGYANQPRESAVGSRCGGNPYHGFNIQFAPQGPGTYLMRATASGQYQLEIQLSGT